MYIKSVYSDHNLIVNGLSKAQFHVEYFHAVICTTTMKKMRSTKYMVLGSSEARARESWSQNPNKGGKIK